MTMIVEREVLVVSDDGSVREEVDAAVARQPGARTVYGRPDPARDSHIVVIDDEGRADAVELVHRLMARGRSASVIYLAANHSARLEAEVRRAGASFYAVKASRDGDLTRVIEVLLARTHG